MGYSLITTFSTGREEVRSIITAPGTRLTYFFQAERDDHYSLPLPCMVGLGEEF